MSLVTQTMTKLKNISINITASKPNMLFHPEQVSSDSRREMEHTQSDIYFYAALSTTLVNTKLFFWPILFSQVKFCSLNMKLFQFFPYQFNWWSYKPFNILTYNMFFSNRQKPSAIKLPGFSPSGKKPTGWKAPRTKSHPEKSHHVKIRLGEKPDVKKTTWV